MKIRFNNSVTTDIKHYICQTRKGNWMIGVEGKDPVSGGTSIFGGSGVQKPFSTLERWDDELAGPMNVTTYEQDGSVNKKVYNCDGWTSYFPTKKILISALNMMGYKQGKRYGYHCWEIVKKES